MDIKIRWPKKGDNPFLKGDPMSPAWASIRWLSSLNANDSIFSMAFKEAGDKIVKEIIRDDDCMPADIYFMPVAYLYRHSLELKLKEIIRLGCDLKLLELKDKPSSVLEAHELHPLWNYVRKIIEGYWPDNEKCDLNAAGRIIQEFHNIDRSGQNLRYSKSRNGNYTLRDMPESVELTHLQDVFEAVFNFLDGCEMGLREAVDMSNEILSEFNSDHYG
jgi:hypothetical protein